MRMKMFSVFVVGLLFLVASTEAGNCHTCFMFPLPSHHPVLVLNKSTLFIKNHTGLPVGLGHNHLIRNPVLEERDATQSGLVNVFRQRFIDRAVRLEAERCTPMVPIIPLKPGQHIRINLRHNQNHKNNHESV